MADFDPSSTIGVKLQRKGYKTAFIGKYLNGFRATVTSAAEMRRYAKGWNQFPVIWENQGKFFDYRLYSKSGTREYGSKARDHSSWVAARNAVRFITDTPADKRLFAMVSLYDGHEPNQRQHDRDLSRGHRNDPSNTGGQASRPINRHNR